MIPGREAVPAPPVTIKSHKEYEVELVIDSHLQWGKLEYLIHWKDYTIKHNSWEPKVNLKNSKKYINKFYKHQPNASWQLNTSIFNSYVFKKIPDCKNVDVRETIAHLADYTPGFHNKINKHEYDAQKDDYGHKGDGEVKSD